MLLEQQKCLVLDIDSQVNNILANGGDDESILGFICYREDLKDLIDGFSQQELNNLCKKYYGFYRAIQVIESLAKNVANGTINLANVINKPRNS